MASAPDSGSATWSSHVGTLESVIKDGLGEGHQFSDILELDEYLREEGVPTPIMADKFQRLRWKALKDLRKVSSSERQQTNPTRPTHIDLPHTPPTSNIGSDGSPPKDSHPLEPNGDSTEPELFIRIYCQQSDELKPFMAFERQQRPNYISLTGARRVKPNTAIGAKLELDWSPHHEGEDPKFYTKTFIVKPDILLPRDVILGTECRAYDEEEDDDGAASIASCDEPHEYDATNKWIDNANPSWTQPRTNQTDLVTTTGNNAAELIAELAQQQTLALQQNIVVLQQHTVALQQNTAALQQHGVLLQSAFAAINNKPEMLQMPSLNPQALRQQSQLRRSRRPP